MVKRGRKTDALTLSAGKAHAALTDVRIKAIAQFRFNEVQYLRHSTSFAQPRAVDLLIWQTKRDVARNRVVDEEDILRHVADRCLPRWHNCRSEQLAVDQDLACRWLVEAEQQI